MDLWGPIPAGVERSMGDEVDRSPEIVYHKPAVNAKARRFRDVSQFRRAGPSAFPPGRKRPGSGKEEALKRPSPSWRPAFPNGYRGEEGASSAMRNLSQAVYGLAHWAPTILGHTPRNPGLSLFF